MTENVYSKLQKARVELQGKNLKKSGRNTYSGYDYFELGDFMPHVNEIFSNIGLFSQVTFTPEMATLTVINTEKPEEHIVFTSPMAEANLKGAHGIQNAGAVQTYQRRYLYSVAMEITEHDVLDATQGKETPTGKNEQPPRPKYASENQVKKINVTISNILKHKPEGTTKDDVLDALRSQGFDFNSVTDIPIGQASKVITQLDLWLKKAEEKAQGGN